MGTLQLDLPMPATPALKDTGRWTGYVKVNYERHSAGCFATEAEAVAAVRALRARLMPYDEPARHA